MAGPVANVLADTGFFSAAAVRQVEQTAAGTTTGTTVLVPLDTTSHHRSVADVMRHRLKTAVITRKIVAVYDMWPITGPRQGFF